VLRGAHGPRHELSRARRPTNHLDLAAIEQLEQALDTFDGTLLLVTHDRRLLEAGARRPQITLQHRARDL